MGRNGNYEEDGEWDAGDRYDPKRGGSTEGVGGMGGQIVGWHVKWLFYLMHGVFLFE